MEKDAEKIDLRVLGPWEPWEGSFKKDDGHSVQKRAPEDTAQEEA